MVRQPLESNILIKAGNIVKIFGREVVISRDSLVYYFIDQKVKRAKKSK